MPQWRKTAQVFILFAFIVVTVDAGDDLSDFSNDLATDVGPLLVLFGESMTKQYLSESTSFLDYFIFAMAPIGILTAIVSSIRVCGSTWLRAFIGRSQEGDGVIEAELCTSTGRDVCELFNRGGITRVLGRPTILELVHVPQNDQKEQATGPDKAKLFLFRDYLKKYDEDETKNDWKRVQGSLESDDGNPFAPNPNLSLNVGIVKPPNKAFFAVAAVGFVLQAGVLSLAGVGVWVLGWNLNQGNSVASRYYAPIMFIAGTVVMCSGMWGCAMLIGQTTYEIRYKRQDNVDSHSRLFWLQPGPQVIGDQCFDPFAHFENKIESDDEANNRLRAWTSSKKNFDQKFEFYTIVAVLTTLIGYITQFIGLRGMKAWVSLAQLGITVVMSILRGLLRTQRLGRNDNKLRRMPDLVTGYELDWLAFEIAGLDSESVSFWPITSLGAVEVGNGTQNSQLCHNLLAVRMRLAHLTGHVSTNNTDDGEYQKWEDGFVKVRSKARQLSGAICHTAQNLLSKDNRKKLKLQVKAVMSLEGNDTMLGIDLDRSPASSKTGWEIDSAQLEAILGLWLWSLVLDPHVKSEDGSGLKTSAAEKTKLARIVSAVLVKNGSTDKPDVKDEIEHWIGPNMASLSMAALTIGKHAKCGLNTLLTPVSAEAIDPVSLNEMLTEVKSGQAPPNTWRFCGWNPVYEVLGDNEPAQEHFKLRVQFSSTNTSLLEICAQELFSALTTSLISVAGLSDLGETVFVESEGVVRLENPTVSHLTKAFVDNGLGSKTDALLCVVPTFGKRLHSPASGDLSAKGKDGQTPLSHAAANGHLALVRLFLDKGAGVDTSDDEGQTLLHLSTNNGQETVVKLLLDKGASAKIKDDSGSMPLHLAAKYGSKAIVKLLLDKGVDVDTKNDEGQTPLHFAAENGRETVVELLVQRGVQTEAKDGTGQTPLHLASESGREAVVKLLLNARANVEATNDDGQTSLHLAAKNGRETIVNLLLAKNVNVNQENNANQTPLFLAAANRRENVAKLLIDNGADVNSNDREGRSPLYEAAKSGRETVVRLLLDKGANIDAKGNHKWTPLFQATVFGYERIVKLLIDRGANITTVDSDGKTLLHHAAGYGHEVVAKLLLDNDANIDAKDDKNRTPLYMTAKYGHDAIVKLLLEKKADANLRSSDGQSPLHVAAEWGYSETIKLLLEVDGDVDAADNDSQTVLHMAARNKDVTIIRMLLAKDADIRARDDIGRTPLHRAAKYGHEAIVKLMLETRVSVNARDDGGKTPLHWAAEWGCMAVLRPLLDKGADINARDNEGQTSLHLAANKGHKAMVRLLLDERADFNMKDEKGQTPQDCAAKCGYKAVVNLFLEKDAVTAA